MGISWVKSAAAPQIIGHLTDPRPAWLWSAGGDTLIWHNPAARLFRAKSKKHCLKLAGMASPIKGQVARVIRLGAIGRTSLSHMQFLSGEKPVSATCACTPLKLADGAVALLVVAVDPIDKEILAEHATGLETNPDLFGTDVEFVLLGAEGQPIAGTPGRLENFADGNNTALHFVAGPDGSEVLLFPDGGTDLPQAVAAIEEASAEEIPGPDEKALDANWSEETPPVAVRNPGGLTSLIDRLADDASLFAPLGPEDDAILQTTAPQPADEPADAAPGESALWKVIGSDFEEDGDRESANAPPVDERTSRYNFDELSRLLADRVGTEPATADNSEPEAEKPAARGPVPGALVNLSEETLVLNRLPLGILIFRDQSVLFANRTLTDLVGYPDSAGLRNAGLASVFTAATDPGMPAGPVTHLARRDGSQVPVQARLQTITWQGRPAFMLTAKPDGTPLGIEGAVRAFAEAQAAISGSGFFETSRAGIITSASGRASELFGRTQGVLIGRPLMLMVGHGDAQKLRRFLEQSSQSAENPRSGVLLRGIDPTLELLVFAEGRAGIVTGYFGFVAVRHHGDAEVSGAAPEPDSAILGRLSRAMRRPLNTIIGFSELIRTSAFGPIDNPRYLEYARDIREAGQDIVGVIDELEDYARLNSGDYELAPADFDLGALLDSCLGKVRRQAGEARVLVRSAISERLPHVRADQASMRQAVLNLLASAIEQTPQGGQVVLSAQSDDDGGISIHVRDSGSAGKDPAEHFVVYREGIDRDGRVRKPMPSSVGLALTRSLIAVNTCSLSIDPTAGAGTLFSLSIPSELTAQPA